MSSAKSNRVAERRRVRNAPLRTRAKTLVSQAKISIESGDGENVEKSLLAAVVALDKAAQKGVLHRRNVSRRKSRLMKQFNASKARSAD